MAQDKLIIRGAREHNLKNINLEIPRDKLVVITGLSGSGKSSLAFDTIYAEGQRRYVESLSAYARQFLGLMEKPDVDQIEGLSPAISIDQKGASRNPRSTVGTVTEIYDYLRLLFARIGQPHCPQCGEPISAQTVEQIVDALQALPDGSRILVLAPLVQARKGEHKGVLEEIRKAGFVRVRVNGELRELDEEIQLDRYKMHTIEAVVDRLVIRHGRNGHGEDEERARLADSVETALRLGDGVMLISDVTDREQPKDRFFSEKFACVKCGFSMPEIEPRTFSFNSPHGACPTCTGLGAQMEFDPDLIVDGEKSLEEGAIVAPGWGWGAENGRSETSYYTQLLRAVCERFGIPYGGVPFKDLSPRQREIILYGAPRGERVMIHYTNAQGHRRAYETAYEGVIPTLQRRYKETTSDYIRGEYERLMSARPCPTCGGKRLRPEALAVTVNGLNIVEVTAKPVAEALRWIATLQSEEERQKATDSLNGSLENLPPSPLTPREQTIARQILKELRARLGFLHDVGLDYLTLDRQTSTLSGGEAQRIRLATQIGSQLMGVMYILDEPSIGLHQRDNARLLRTLLGLRDLGNTVLVVEHDEETMRHADWIVDLGPGAGQHGGEVVYSGPADGILQCRESLTGQYLSGLLRIPVPTARRTGNGHYIVVKRASENNLKHIDVRFPLGKFICVTGVSGSGKSTLVNEILYKAIAQRMYRAKEKPGRHQAILGIEHIDKVIDIDQSPIGRTPRSNPATYTNVFTAIRDLFASLPESKLRGYKAGRFSFNVKGGRCEACQGDGIIRIEMQFLPDVYVPCEVCHGRRYNREALEIKYKGKSIADVLDMTVEEALHFFENIPAIHGKLKTLMQVGLGYIKLGQPATTLSGGEAQRIKLSKELSRRATGRTLYILDEPTTGLHFADVQKLLHVLHDLVDRGNTVVVIEHNLDVIKSADWIIDLGPEGGEQGGYVVAEGTPEQVMANPRSYTGQFLHTVLEGREAKQPAQVIAELAGADAYA
ncbi:MAG: excinuclease ABC subunit UvrA [Caldilineales bacterium]|nr:excinuclease ABC subunit UvrA [Caldilineales bacterium]MDW8316616.1 excinuclease ABC subunit UvrA [Anaerolineae bacterium]